MPFCYIFRDAMSQIIRDAGNNSNFASIPGGAIEGINFCYMRFQLALQMKWSIVMLRRFEEILGGRGEFLKAFPNEWDDYEGEFARIYGPVVVTYENYKELLTQFRLQRLKMYIEMFERERDVLQVMLESGKSIAEWSSLELEIREKRLQLETSLNAIPEANLDINPYTNRIGMDFFVLPRPTHSIVAYEVQPKEMYSLTPHSLKDDGIHRIEGYNPAVLDIGRQFPLKVIGDESRQGYFRDTLPTSTAFKQWYQTLLDLKAEVKEYPVGVESKTLVKKFRENSPWLDDEPLFGKYSDKEGVLHVADVFYTQFLGKDKIVILFPSVFEGLIITPEEILLRIWNKIKHMLELHKSIKVGDLQIQYETFFGQPLYPINWGFAGVAEFIEYSLQNFTEELADVKCVEEKEVIVKVEKLENDNSKGDDDDGDNPRDTGNSYMLQSPWQLSDETLPPNYVFKLPDHISFDSDMVFGDMMF